MRGAVIAISGTPGTGKSAVAEVLAKKLGASLIRLNDLVEKTGIYEVDADGTKAVRVEDLRRAFRREIAGISGPVVVEGHMSHLLPKGALTHVVVLRTHPRVIMRRLKARGYNEKKITENAEAEALDIILWEAVKEHGIERVFEIDTTGRKPEECADLLVKAIRGRLRLRPGRIRWLEEFLGDTFKRQ